MRWGVVVRRSWVSVPVVVVQSAASLRWQLLSALVLVLMLQQLAAVPTDREYEMATLQ